MIAPLKPYRGFRIKKEIPGGWLTFFAMKGEKRILQAKSVGDLRKEIDKYLAAAEGTSEPKASCSVTSA
jgi:hypothetical protein